YHLSLYYRYSFNLHLRLIFKEAFDFDERHCRKMASYLFAPARSDLACACAILAFIHHVDDEPRDLRRSSASLFVNCDDIGERAIKLLDEIRADNPLLFIPRNLSGDEK